MLGFEGCLIRLLVFRRTTATIAIFPGTTDGVRVTEGWTESSDGRHGGSSYVIFILLLLIVVYDHDYVRVVRDCHRPMDSLGSQWLALLAQRFFFQELLEYRIDNIFRNENDFFHDFS